MIKNNLFAPSVVARFRRNPNFSSFSNTSAIPCLHALHCIACRCAYEASDVLRPPDDPPYDLQTHMLLSRADVPEDFVRLYNAFNRSSGDEAAAVQGGDDCNALRDQADLLMIPETNGCARNDTQCWIAAHHLRMALLNRAMCTEMEMCRDLYTPAIAYPCDMTLECTGTHALGMERCFPVLSFCSAQLHLPCRVVYRNS